MSPTTPSRGWAGMFAGGLLFFIFAALVSASPTPETVLQRIAELRAQIAHHDALYFQKAAPEITDAAYDTLKRELRALEQQYPSESRTAGLHDDHTEGFAKVVHLTPMLGLEKAYTEAELRAFCERTERTLGRPACYVVEPKIDGISVSATYENGRFVRAVTRGNGESGDDITANARMIRSLPAELRKTKPDGTTNTIPGLIELRGEIYLSNAAFIRLNRERQAEGEPLFAHPRNAAAGTIKSGDPAETAERQLDVVFYGFGSCTPESLAPASQQTLHAQLHDWGLPVLETFRVASGTDETWAAVQALGNQRRNLSTPIDGAVVKLDEIGSRHQFVNSGEGPRWAIAFKYPPERITTRLRAITLQVGRTGLLTPVAELEPVKLAGSTISRASLHNREQIARLDLRLGDSVFLEKAGEIIPEIVGVDFKQRPASAVPYEFPDRCPSCGDPVESDPSTATTRCHNFDCPARHLRRLAHFVGKSGVDIESLGESTLQGLLANGTVRKPSDLYALTPQHFLKKPGVGKKTASKILAEIDRSRHAEIWRFINGLGIPHVGPVSARLLARHFGTLEKFSAARPSDLPAELSRPAAKSVAEYLGNENNINELVAISKFIRPPASATPAQVLAGKSFVLTGRLPTLARAEAIRRIEAAGGIVRTTVSRATSFVVAGESPGETIAMARKHGVPVIDEAELLHMLSRSP